MQLSWLVRRRMVVLIPARGCARTNPPGGAALRKQPTNLLVGPRPGALHDALAYSCCETAPAPSFIRVGLCAILWCTRQACGSKLPGAGILWKPLISLLASQPSSSVNVVACRQACMQVCCGW